MNPYLYDLKAEHDDKECRAVARRKTILHLWRKHGPSVRDTASLKILEVGCGTGATLASLNPFGKTFGIDISPNALRHCRERGIRRVAQADGTSLPFADQVFDLLVTVDVLEHIEDDTETLKQFHRVLKPDGMLLLIVPAFASLWSSRDIRLNHKRRYSRQELNQKTLASGFAIQKLAYLDALSFPFLYLWVKSKGLKNPGVADIRMDVLALPKPINFILLHIMRLETRLLTHFPSPFGVALLCVARKEGSNAGS